jgi:hypothetical protein
MNRSVAQAIPSHALSLLQLSVKYKCGWQADLQFRQKKTSISMLVFFIQQPVKELEC